MKRHAAIMASFQAWVAVLVYLFLLQNFVWWIDLPALAICYAVSWLAIYALWRR